MKTGLKNHRSVELHEVIKLLADTDIKVNFDFPFQWTVDGVTSYVASAIFHPSETGRVSFVATLGSAEFQSLASKHLDCLLLQYARVFIYLSTFLHTYASFAEAGVKKEEVEWLLLYVKQQLAQRLDANLKPRELGC